MIPISPRLVLAGVAVAAVFLFGWSIKHRLDKGEAAAQEVQRLSAELFHERKAREVTAAAVSGLSADRTKVRTVTKEVTREIFVRVPADAPPVPGYWRVLHDAAALGESPAATSGADAAPVPAQDAASVVVENYGTCHDISNQLIRLQQWVKGVTNASPDN